MTTTIHFTLTRLENLTESFTQLIWMHFSLRNSKDSVSFGLLFFFFFLIYFIYLFIYFWLCWVFGSCEGFL